MSVDVKLSKKQIKTLIQSGAFLGSLLSKIAGPLMKVAMPLAKNVLVPLGLTAAMSAIDGSIQKKIHGSGAGTGTTTLVISNDDIMQIIQALEDSNILLKGVTKSIATQTREQKGGFLSMLLGTLGVSLLGHLLSEKGVMRGGEGGVRAGEGVIRAGERLVRGGEGGVRAGEGVKNKKKQFNTILLMPPHPLTNFEINDYYANEPKFNGVFSRDSLPRTIKNGGYVTTLDEHGDIGTHWIALYVKNV